MINKNKIIILQYIGKALGIFWFILWLYLGIKFLFFWNEYSPNMAVIFFPVYFFLWIGTLPLGCYFIKIIAQRITSKLKCFKNIEC